MHSLLLIPLVSPDCRRKVGKSAEKTSRQTRTMFERGEENTTAGFKFMLKASKRQDVVTPPPACHDKEGTAYCRKIGVNPSAPSRQLRVYLPRKAGEGGPASIDFVIRERRSLTVEARSCLSYSTVVSPTLATVLSL
ncbi:hypothetical protein Bbelb_093490 [Branchiostoma belcheri]|nr:hypothetical protein Bbelb_093490 [Branchiostoma belcheri]